VNIPFTGGYGDGEYIAAFQRVIVPIAREFDPQFVLISAGFDGHARDPLSQMRLTKDGYAAMSRSLLGVARDHSEGRVVAVLEGGYALDALQESVASVLEEMGGEKLDMAIPQARGAEVVLDAVTRVQKGFWKL
jgi:acetoin utilization deacetylase AcuC-like enzyme